MATNSRLLQATVVYYDDDDGDKLSQTKQTNTNNLAVYFQNWLT